VAGLGTPGMDEVRPPGAYHVSRPLVRPDQPGRSRSLRRNGIELSVLRSSTIGVLSNAAAGTTRVLLDVAQTFA